MSMEQGLAKRLKDTQSLRDINQSNLEEMDSIRRKAMRSLPLDAQETKWMVRTLHKCLAFETEVLNLWIEDDTKTLKTLMETGSATPSTEPRLGEPVTEPEPEIEEEPEEAIPEPVLSGIDKINALLEED